MLRIALALAAAGFVMTAGAVECDQASAGVACGDGAEAGQPSAVSVGNGARTLPWDANGVPTAATDVTAVGYNATATVDATALGAHASAFGNAAVAVGKNSRAAAEAVALGTSARADGQASLSLGAQSSATGGVGAIAIGYQAQSNGGIALGWRATALTGHMALGTDSLSAGTQASAVGFASQARGDWSNAFGTSAVAAGEASLALGNLATAHSYSALAAGLRVDARGIGTIALGSDTTASADNAIAVGARTNASGTGAVAFGSGAVASGFRAVAIGEGSIAAEADTVSFGSLAATRRILNISAGTADSDAVNVAQLRAIAPGFGGGSNVVNGVFVNPTYNLSGGSFGNVGDALLYLDGRITNISLTPGPQGPGGPSGPQGPQGPQGPIGGNGRDGVAGADCNTAVCYDDASKSSVTLNKGGAATRVTNVAAGVNSTDAVNVSQLEAGVTRAVTTSNAYTDQRVSELRGDMWQIDRNARGGIAASMAIAGLPQAYAPGRRMAAIAGSGYRGEAGLAVGISGVTDDGKWVYKLAGSSNTTGDFGLAVGAGIQW